jgi:uncharacterized protein YndB with AHSA1/START domain
MSSDQVTAERLVAAPPAEIFAILSDAGKHQLIDGSGTVQGTKAESEPLSMGSTFGMSMRMGLPYSTRNEVVEFEPNRRIAWRTTGLFGLVGGRTWRYELVDQGSSTIVRETWDLSRDRQRFFLRRSNLPRATKRNMERTLERLASVVEKH